MSTTRDDCPPCPDDDGSTRLALSRRSLLRTGVSLGIASGVAGCAGLGLPDVTSYRFNAIPATLPGDQGKPSYSLDRLAEETVERTPTIMGVDIDVALTNQFAHYTGAQDSLGILSTPTATIAAEDRNPLATDPLGDLLVSATGARLLAALGVADQSSVQWTEGPRSVATGTGDLLGQSTAITAFAGVIREFGFVLLTVARVTDASDAVLAAVVQQQDDQAPALVGTDGYVTRQTVTESIQRLQAVLPRIERGGAGIELLESTRITMPGDEPNYLRVLASNQFHDSTLVSVSVTAQLFDEQGRFLDHRTAELPRLGADEQFEAYLPYVTDDIAGYAVEAGHATRPITAAPADGVAVTNHGRDDDTVTVRLRNTLNQRVPFVSLEVTFYDADGSVLATSQRTVADLADGKPRELDVVYMPPAFESPASIADYAVDVLEYSGSLRYVR